MNKYFDNGTTSFPKPQAVINAVTEASTTAGSYARGAYGMAVETTRTVEACRDKLAELMHVNHSEDICFTLNATTAINTILQGMERQNTTVWISPLEHNAVMRPLEYLRLHNNITIKILPHHSDGLIDLDAYSQIKFTDQQLIIVNHQSNVNGVIQPIDEIKRLKQRACFIVDATQSLGNIPLNAQDIDFIAFTGHKSLLGVTGVGGFYTNPTHQLKPLIYGGTGSHSDSYRMPEDMPDRFEAGTPNTVGIAALLAALENRPTPEHTIEDFHTLITQISQIQGMHLYKADHPINQGNLFSITHTKHSTSDICDALFQQYGISTRSGLHCARMAHETLGSLPQGGTLRIAASPYHTPEDFDYLVQALSAICTT